MRVLVCGGRDFNERQVMAWELQRQAMMYDDIAFIAGYDPDDERFQGADQLAYEWAVEHRYPVFPFPALWRKHGRAAGPIRNGRMLALGRPQKILAFPGGSGTADMVRRAKAAGVPVAEAPTHPAAYIGTGGVA